MFDEHRLKGEQAVWSEDDRYLVFQVVPAGGRPVLATLDLERLEVTTRPLLSPHFAVSPNGRLAFMSKRDTVTLLEPHDRSRQLPYPLDDLPSTLVFSPDDSRVAAIVSAQGAEPKPGQIVVWEPESGRAPRSWKLPAGALQSCAFSADGKALLALFTKPGGGRLLCCWTAEWLVLASVVLPESDACGVEFAPDGQLCYAFGPTELLELSLPALETIRRLDLSPAQFEFGSLGWPALEAMANGKIRVQTYRESLVVNAETLQVEARVSQTCDAALSADGSTLWVRNGNSAVSSLHLGAEVAESARPPARLARPLNPTNQFGHELAVRSPLTGRPVVELQPLALTPDGALEWVAWTSQGDLYGSARWRDFARPAWRRGAKKESRDAVQAAFRNPSALGGEVAAPVSYPFSPAVARGEAAAVSRLLDEIVANPGAWNQMCALISDRDKSLLPLPGHQRDSAVFFVSETNFERVRDGRDRAVLEIARRLPGIKSAPVPAYQGSAKDSSRDWQDVLEIYLLLLEDLNGSEALPALLELESTLARLYPGLPETTSDGQRYPTHALVLSTVAALLGKEGVIEPPSYQAPLAYSEVERQRLLSLARAFLKTTPPEKRLGARGMSVSQGAR